LGLSVAINSWILVSVSGNFRHLTAVGRTVTAALRHGLFVLQLGTSVDRNSTNFIAKNSRFFKLSTSSQCYFRAGVNLAVGYEGREASKVRPSINN
jgi:hypothetical protein